MENFKSMERFKIDKNDKRVNQKPFLRFSTCGCGILTCNCSPTYFLSFSTGREGITIKLTKEEAEEIQKAFAEGYINASIED